MWYQSLDMWQVQNKMFVSVKLWKKEEESVSVLPFLLIPC